jgi:hypothetical protein
MRQENIHMRIHYYVSEYLIDFKTVGNELKKSSSYPTNIRTQRK